ncbi:MlaA family lipoprotein [Tabrizicola sp. BL-A-41-H6]|uniref:MlaA family lipoprotein n=1 Tax=Tabrizicola sp. BL-A-41-H6 TaxID=3421107 RepID=UPI003D677BDB
MGLRIFLIRSDALHFAGALTLAAFVAGCAGTPGPGEMNDPYEQANREVHEFNRGVDSMLFGPASKGYGAVVPDPAQRVIANVANTLDLPSDITNDLFQANVGDAAINSLRLAVNLTMGVVGLFDAATALGLPSRPTDFGETLSVWGVGEGVYLELPLWGPSTSRDATGLVVDFILNPARQALPYRESAVATGAEIFSLLGDRDRFSETVESILYDSADSYAQARLLYLQNRRFELGQVEAGSAAEDDAFIDPYEDPYAQ